MAVKKNKLLKINNHKFWHMWAEIAYHWLKEHTTCWIHTHDVLNLLSSYKLLVTIDCSVGSELE